MRRTCDDKASAVDRYNSMSWRPAASLSRVGGRPVVIRERRAETSDGDIGCRALCNADFSSSGVGLGGLRDL